MKRTYTYLLHALDRNQTPVISEGRITCEFADVLNSIMHQSLPRMQQNCPVTIVGLHVTLTVPDLVKAALKMEPSDAGS